jgi:L-amino acid N-acyltransferase YncA
MEIEIRQAGVEDAEAIAGVYAPYVTDDVRSFEQVAPDAAEMARRIAGILAKYPYLLARCDGKVAGYAYASEHRTRSAYRWAVETTIYLDKAFWRRGIGRALYDVLFPLLVKQGFVTAYAGVTLPNPASVAIHESFGFKLMGVYHGVGFKRNAWHDVGWWEKQLQPAPVKPGEPIAWLAMPAFGAVRRVVGE